MAVTLHALDDEAAYTRLRFCACCPLTPGAPGCTATGGARARLTAILTHVDSEVVCHLGARCIREFVLSMQNTQGRTN
jgi:hypothetical protein